MGVVV